LSDIFPVGKGLKQGDALSPLLLNFALEYAIMNVQLNGTDQMLAYADDLNLLGDNNYHKENQKRKLRLCCCLITRI
jgi:retron-type reverse transcriptase